MLSNVILIQYIDGAFNLKHPGHPCLKQNKIHPKSGLTAMHLPLICFCFVFVFCFQISAISRVFGLLISSEMWLFLIINYFDAFFLVILGYIVWLM